MKYILRSREELEELKKGNLRMSLRNISIESDSIQDPQIEKRLNRHFFACGCQTGSVFVLLTLTVCLVIGFLFGFYGLFEWWKIMLYVAFAALIGKLLGLFWRLIQLRKLYKQLESLLP